MEGACEKARSDAYQLGSYATFLQCQQPLTVPAGCSWCSLIRPILPSCVRRCGGPSCRWFEFAGHMLRLNEVRVDTHAVGKPGTPASVGRATYAPPGKGGTVHVPPF